MKYATYRPSCLTWFAMMCKLNRLYNLLQVKSLPEGLTKPLTHSLTSSVGVSGRDRELHFSILRCVIPMRTRIEILAPSKFTGFMKMKRSENTTLASQRARARHIHPTGVYNDGRDGWRMPEIPLKISRAIIGKKTRELCHNNFVGQGESVLCNFAGRAPMPKRIENPKKEELRC